MHQIILSEKIKMKPLDFNCLFCLNEDTWLSLSSQLTSFDILENFWVLLKQSWSFWEPN